MTTDRIFSESDLNSGLVRENNGWSTAADSLRDRRATITRYHVCRLVLIVVVSYLDLTYTFFSVNDICTGKYGENWYSMQVRLPKNKKQSLTEYTYQKTFLTLHALLCFSIKSLVEFYRIIKLHKTFWKILEVYKHTYVVYSMLWK